MDEYIESSSLDGTATYIKFIMKRDSKLICKRLKKLDLVLVYQGVHQGAKNGATEGRIWSSRRLPPFPLLGP